MYSKRRNPCVFADAKILKFDALEGLDTRFRGNDGVQMLDLTSDA
jgi:hypothetical protein